MREEIESGTELDRKRRNEREERTRKERENKRDTKKGTDIYREANNKAERKSRVRQKSGTVMGSLEVLENPSRLCWLFASGRCLRRLQLNTVRDVLGANSLWSFKFVRNSFLQFSGARKRFLDFDTFGTSWYLRFPPPLSHHFQKGGVTADHSAFIRGPCHTRKEHHRPPPTQPDQWPEQRPWNQYRV